MHHRALFLSFALFGCSGAADTGLLDSGGGGNDGGNGSDGTVTADGGDPCDVLRCAQIPAGFHVLTLQATGDCPNGLDATDVVTAPAAGDGACTCACNVTTQPDCTTGNITRTLDGTSTATCGSPASTFSANGGACGTVNDLYLDYYHYATTAPAATGGVCEFDATVDSSKISSTSARMCTPPASCLGAVCDANATVCVANDGDVACPSNFPVKTLVGASASADCSTCTNGGACAVAGQCTGTLKFFTDNACTTGEVDFTADGTCVANPTSDIGPYLSYDYAGTVKSATCTGTPPTSSATPKLVTESTVCCHNAQ